ncbi:nuclear transport factor 2 family protein [Kribbella lupini]|uniref:Nuclear transport factor 2 family protein n=1 Tax=Kribbella lupini TaxID=291602 RepID=A0ABN2CJ23_9ACTN
MTSTTITADVEAACRRLVVAFAHHLDHRRFHEVAALFTADGVWHRRGVSMRGRDQILAFLERREKTVVELHVMATTLVEQLTRTSCAATSYATIYRTHRVGDDVPAITGPSAIGEFHDRFELTDDGWRFTYRASEPVFVIDGASHSG